MTTITTFGPLRAKAGGAIALMLAATLILTACGTQGSPGPSAAGSQPAATPKSGGILKAALTGEPDTLDPATSTIYTGAQVYDNIFSKLIDIAPDGQVVGGLATSWNQTDDLTWTFDLVDNATFHNGEHFTAKDVKYTFERILDPATASSYAPLYDQIASVEAVSDTQVVFHLKAPFGPFLSNLANNGEIVNQKAIESNDPARVPIGTGPFKFVDWVQGDHITLERNDNYFAEGLPYLDGVEFKFLLVDQSRIEALRSGELDWVDAVPLQQLETLKTDSDFNYVTAPLAGIPDYLGLNVTHPPFDNLALRQAVVLALDLEAIRAVAYSGAGEVGLMEVPSGVSWFGGTNPYASGPNLDAARAKLAEAGYPDGLTVHYLGLPQYPELLRTGEVVRDQLRQIGINMEIEQVDVSVWFDKFVTGDYEITSAYQERTIDPDNFYALVLRTGGIVNTTGYSSSRMDALIDEARGLTDEAARKALYEQIRQIVWDEAPIIFAHFETINYLMRNDVKGSTVNPTLELRLENVWLDR
jgi:peptide/nickel transport system substrate-binding protein